MFVAAMRRISYWKASLEQEDQSGDYQSGRVRMKGDRAWMIYQRNHRTPRTKYMLNK